MKFESYGLLAQLAEHPVLTRKVVGSLPTGSTKIMANYTVKVFSDGEMKWQLGFTEKISADLVAFALTHDPSYAMCVISVVAGNDI